MSPHLPTQPAARVASAPWLVAGVVTVGAVALFLAFRTWAQGNAPGLGLAHPLAALPSLLLLALALSARAWPVRRKPAAAPAAPALTKAAVRNRVSADWDRAVRHASQALQQRGISLLGAADGWAPGTDLVLTQRGRPYLVCARHWRAQVIDGAVVRELALDIARQGAGGGMLVSAVQAFTPQARQLARLHGIALQGRSATLDETPAARRPAPSRPMPILRADEELRTARPSFAPTEPMSTAERARAVPVLRPDHEVTARRADFQPTVPMTRETAQAGRAALPPLSAREALSLSISDTAPLQRVDFQPTEPLAVAP